MRVLLASIHPRAFSGQVHSLKALARVLRSLGHDVPTLTVSIPESPRRLPSSIHYLFSTLRVVQTVANPRNLHNADLVHLNLPTPGFTPLADWLASRLPVPLVVGFEAPLISHEIFGSVVAEAAHKPFFYIPRLLINNPVVARLARYNAAAYVVSSNYQRQQIERLGKGSQSRIAVIPNVVDFDLGVDDGKALARARLGLPADDPIVGYVGHFHPVKGVETLAQAFSTLRSSVPNARLALAWSGLGNSDRLSQLLESLGCLDHAILLGRTNLVDLLRSIDALALPYRYPIGQNSFPNLLLEAQGIGVPLVTTNIPIVAEACQEDTALLVPPSNSDDLASALRSMIEDPERRARMIQRQHAHYADNFAPLLLARRYEQLYSQVLDEASPTTRTATRPSASEAQRAEQTAWVEVTVERPSDGGDGVERGNGLEVKRDGLDGRNGRPTGVNGRDGAQDTRRPDAGAETQQDSREGTNPSPTGSTEQATP